MTPLRFLPVGSFASALVVLGCAAYHDPAGTGGYTETTTVTDNTGGGGNDDGKHGPVNHSNGGDGGNGGAGGSTTTSSNTTTAGGSGGGTTGSGGTSDAGAGGGAIQQCVPGSDKQTYYLSSDDSSSMGSPAIAREYLNSGMAPPVDQIRIWEFLNYYRVRYDLPQDDRLGLYAHFTDTPEGKYHLQIGVQSFAVTRPTMALTFVVDTSGSLVGEGIAREREAIRAMAKQLRKNDHVNFVTWSNADAVVFADHVITGPEDDAVLHAIDQLQPGGGSDLHAGLTKAYQLAGATQAADRLSRVVLISDGGANLGVLDATVIADAAKQADDAGIYLVGIGLGPAPAYSDKLMNAVTDAGRGAYVYLDSTDEANAVLGDRFDEVMDISARAVRVAVELPSYFVFHEFYGEGMSTVAADVQPQHLAPGDAMIFEQVLGVTTGAAECDLDSVTITATWQTPLLHPDLAETTSTLTHTLGELRGQPWQLLKAEAITLYAKALKTRSKADFDAAAIAIDAARKDPTIVQDPYKSELDDIDALLLKFPQAEIKNP